MVGGAGAATGMPTATAAGIEWSRRGASDPGTGPVAGAGVASAVEPNWGSGESASGSATSSRSNQWSSRDRAAAAGVGAGTSAGAGGAGEGTDAGRAGAGAAATSGAAAGARIDCGATDGMGTGLSAGAGTSAEGAAARITTSSSLCEGSGAALDAPTGGTTAPSLPFAASICNSKPPMRKRSPTLTRRSLPGARESALTEIDTVALLLADAPILPDQFWPTMQQSQRISKRIIWEGLGGGLWQPIDAHNADDRDGFRELRAGLQLASRNGMVDTNTLHAFNEMMIAFAQSIGAVSQREDVTLATARAQAVDAFCADTDIEIAINVIGKSGGTFATTKVRGLAESSGLTALDSGEYELRDELGHALFTLRNMNADEPPGIKHAGAYLSGLTFALDVPRATQPGSVFTRMITLALRFADTLQGDVVDDNRKVLTANGRKVIADTIGGIAEEMQAKGVVPGSSAALRLYS